MSLEKFNRLHPEDIQAISAALDGVADEDTFLLGIEEFHRLYEALPKSFDPTNRGAFSPSWVVRLASWTERKAGVMVVEHVSLSENRDLIAHDQWFVTRWPD